MQLVLDLNMPSLIVEVDARLRTAYGVAPRFGDPDPVSQLVLAIISSKTLDAVSWAAYEALEAHYLEHDGDWLGLRDATPAAVYSHIRAVTFPEDKAARLPLALQTIWHRRGALDLDFLATWPVEAAHRWLRDLPGAGPKVAATVLNFSTLARPVLVMDSHYLRVARRVGLLPACGSDTIAYRIIERQVPESWSAEALGDHHWLMKIHSQRRCHKTAPLCVGCALGDLCLIRQPARREVARRPQDLIGNGS
ncbi:MAG TPA: hypothetical protein VGG27_10735 [Magnetospirillaceae bacterium]|jgi:endonuclease-3